MAIQIDKSIDDTYTISGLTRDQLAELEDAINDDANVFDLTEVNPIAEAIADQFLSEQIEARHGE